MAKSGKLRTFSSTVSIYGGPGSGFFDHLGRQGFVGGSLGRSKKRRGKAKRKRGEQGPPKKLDIEKTIEKDSFQPEYWLSESPHALNIVPAGENYCPQIGWY